MEEEIKKLKQENASLKECINDVLIILADYDGFRTAPGLMHLIDEVAEILKNRKPVGLTNSKGEQCCPLCFSELKDDINGDNNVDIDLDILMGIISYHNVKKLLEFVKEGYVDMVIEEHLLSREDFLREKNKYEIAIKDLEDFIEKYKKD